MSLLTTTDEVIDALGGTSVVARLLGLSPQAVHGFRVRVRGSFPPDTFLVLTGELEAMGKGAPPSLWRMKERRPGAPPSEPTPVAGRAA